MAVDSTKIKCETLLRDMGATMISLKIEMKMKKIADGTILALLKELDVEKQYLHKVLFPKNKGGTDPGFYEWMDCEYVQESRLAKYKEKTSKDNATATIAIKTIIQNLEKIDRPLVSLNDEKGMCIYYLLGSKLPLIVDLLSECDGINRKSELLYRLDDAHKMFEKVKEHMENLD